MTPHQKAICLRSYHRRAARYRTQGKNTRGKTYGRTPPIAPANRPLQARRRSLANWRRRRDRFAAQGKNTRGQEYSRADYTAPARLQLLINNSGTGRATLATTLKSRA